MIYLKKIIKFAFIYTICLIGYMIIAELVLKLSFINGVIPLLPIVSKNIANIFNLESLMYLFYLECLTFLVSMFIYLAITHKYKLDKRLYIIIILFFIVPNLLALVA